MTRQLPAPVQHLSLNPTNRFAEDVFHMVEKGSILLDPPYQRGSVWTIDQRLDLMYSYLAGYPIGAVIFNDRMRGVWFNRAGILKVAYAVIDGRQRLETICAWFRGELAIPASWIPAEFILPARKLAETGDGPYVSVDDLTESGQRYVSSCMPLPVVTAQVDSIEAEAEIFRLVNAGGTPQTADDLARAARIEKKK